MRVRMIFSTRYCGLVPWMLCASFTVRFAMAAAKQLPSTPRRAAPLPFREGPQRLPLPGRRRRPPSYLRAIRSLPAAASGCQSQTWRRSCVAFSRLLPSPSPVRGRWRGRGAPAGLWREILSPCQAGARAAAAAVSGPWPCGP